MGSFEVLVPAGTYEVFTVSGGSEVPAERARRTVTRLDEPLGLIEIDGRTDTQVTLRLPAK